MPGRFVVPDSHLTFLKESTWSKNKILLVTLHCTATIAVYSSRKALSEMTLASLS
jgi:hypothetical protein